MRPAFDSPGQAIAFSVLLALVLLSPILAVRKILPPRAAAYTFEDWRTGTYPWIYHQIFEQTNDFDMVFMGSSHLGWAIETPAVQRTLSAKLGREAMVNTLCWGGGGYDALYYIAQDLLDHHRVKMLVFYDQNCGPNHYDPMPFWFRFGDNADDLSGLTPLDWAHYYAGSIMGMPRNILSLCRPSLPGDINAPNVYKSLYNSPNPATQLGAVSQRVTDDSKRPYISFTPQNGVKSTETLIYSDATKTNFLFSPAPLPKVQAHFARKFLELARGHGCKLVLVHIPVLAESRQHGIPENHFWRETGQADVPIVGIPAERFFAGLTQKQCEQLYGDPSHLSENGQKYYTSLISPALLKLYEEIPVAGANH